ncbi:MAG: UbiD family decarboxylase [Deferribacteraceae bacterium]|jgi:UbiD family decarboxylase|nr:UbiD family decarboxylase [Deferribacteraceae bacterium]
MAFSDIREYLKALEAQGLMRRVTREVDHSWEVACLAKWMYQAVPADKRFGLYFEKIKGSNIPVTTAIFGATDASVAVALGCKVDEINKTIVNALRNRIKPNIVNSAPCQEVVLTGDTAKLSILPIPTWTPGKDKAPYLTAITVTRDHDTGVQNVAVYRTMVQDDNTVLINLSNGRQGTRNVKTWFDKGKKAPIAWVILTEPTIHLATVANLPYGQDEIELAGGLKGEAIDLVPCKMSDLLVPANSEIVIEGELTEGEFGDEGPFGEFAGFMGPVERKPVAHITAITHRKDAIYHGYSSQIPPSESTTIQSLMNAGVILYTLNDLLGESAVEDVYIDQNFGGSLAHAIIAMTPQFPGHGKQVGRTVADVFSVKRVTVVDPDIDIRDSFHIDWAMNSRYSPKRDTVIIDDIFMPLGMDPSVRDAYGKVSQGSKIVCDATSKFDAGSFSLPSKELMEKALVSWKECGLPELEIPKRAKLRIDKS